MRWRLKLEEYDYKIIYRKGKDNKVADALSRIEIHPIETQSMIANTDPNEDSRLQEDFSELFSEIINIPEIVDIQPEDLQDLDDILSNEVANNPITSVDNHNHVNIISDVIIPNPQPPEIPDSNETQHSSQENPILEIPISEQPLNKFKHQIILSISNDALTPRVNIIKIFDNKTRLKITVPIRNLEVHLVKVLKEYLKPKTLYGIIFQPNMAPILISTIQKHFQHSAFKLVQSNILLKDIESSDTQTEKIKYHHETKTTHRGINETKQSLSKIYYWPNMIQDVTNYINTCIFCQTSKYERHPNIIKFKPTPIGEHPFEHIYIDTFSVDKTKFLTIIDSFSRFAQAYPVHLSATGILDGLLQFMAHYGLPHKITCDSGPEFKNNLVENFCETHKITLHYITPRNPNSNSPIERFHSTLVEELRILKQETPNRSINTQMLYAILGYNNTIHSATKFTPLQIIKGNISYENPFDLTLEKLTSDYMEKHANNIKILYEIIKENNEKSKDLTKVNSNRNDPPEINVEENVFLKDRPRNKLSPLYRKIQPKSNRGIKIKTQKTTYHKRSLKPQRILIRRKPVVVSDDNVVPGASHNLGDGDSTTNQNN